MALRPAAPKPPQPPEQRGTGYSSATIPFWRDVRVLGVLAQIIFVIFVFLGLSWILGNVARGLTSLGGAQFLCEDGTSNVRCAFNFMSTSASFDIGEAAIDYSANDSYWRALQVGLANTAKVAVVGIILATILGTVAGVAVLSNNWLLSRIFMGYIDIMRNTPLLVQLFFLYFVVILNLPPIRESLRPGLGIYLNQRGIQLPWPEFTPASLWWFAFVLLAVVQFQVLWVLLGQRELKTGKGSNRLLWASLSAIAIVIFGWFFASNMSTNQALLVTRASRVAQARTTIIGLETIVINRLPITRLTPETVAALTPEQLTEATLRVCVLRDSSTEANLAAQLDSRSIPFRMQRFDRMDQAGTAYGDGECDVLAGERVLLAAALPGLEAPGNHLLASVREVPVVMSIPRLEGLNLVGGTRLTPEFAAILFGLVFYTGAFIAEIVRAGIQSVNRGQSEAARALGLSESQRLQLVVLPQALRVIIPPLTSQYLNLAKNSSLAIAVGFADLVNVTNTILNQSGRVLQVIILVMLSYLTISLAISALLNWYNRRMALVER